MPHYNLTEQIKPKATLEGISVFKISEPHTAKSYHRCENLNTKRIMQSVFECHDCGLVYNADLNGAMNIGKGF